MKRRFRSQKVYDNFGIINIALASGKTNLGEAMELASAIIAEDNELYGSEEPTSGNPWPNGPTPGINSPEVKMTVYSGVEEIDTI